MRLFLLSLFAISLSLLPACNFRSSAPEAEVSPIAPTSLADTPPVAADQEIASVEPAAASSLAEPEFTLDPAPPPPTDSSSSPPEEPSSNTSSAETALQSVARVLQGAVEGAGDEAGKGSTGSVFGSIGRALSKGFREATAGENATDN